MADAEVRLDAAVMKMHGDGVDAIDAVVRLKEEALVPAGREFVAAQALRASYGLSVIQLHEVVGWLKGERTIDHLREALPGTGS
ncbi:hypothetical protein [Dactylosporangium sp. CS-033363]|uniref:hypothetical protein n=1 Tax=Dactylosporangium sp. CS-033363 TaxID=3239935 RepID=UPI003D9356CB